MAEDPPPPAPAKPPWYTAVAVDIGKSAVLLLALDSAAAVVFKQIKLPATDLLYVTGIGAGLTALISALANITNLSTLLRRKKQ